MRSAVIYAFPYARDSRTAASCIPESTELNRVLTPRAMLDRAHNGIYGKTLPTSGSRSNSPQSVSIAK